MGKGLYLVAFLATIAIILVAFFAVKSAEDNKAGQLNEEITQLALENELYTAFADFGSGGNGTYCLVVNESISGLSKRADLLERQLDMYKENSFNTEEFFKVKRNYLITNMLLFRNFLRANSSCGLKIKPLLFFYSEDKSCGADCDVIYAQLWQLKSDCNQFRNFNFPFNWDAYSFTRILEKEYGVEKPGTIIIDGNKYDSLLSLPQLYEKVGCVKP